MDGAKLSKKTVAEGLERAVRGVDSLESLLGVLRDELGWPLEASAPQEETTFDWSAEELKLTESSARRLRHGVVRQLRPFTTNQPWGIFLVEFSEGQVYRTALRQVLRGLVPSRRRSSTLPAWKHDNLLFICCTSDYERFTFAHFKGSRLAKARLATFGWKRDDRYIRTLCECNLPALAYPDDDSDSDGWVASWVQAFDKEPVTREFFRRFDAALAAMQADLQAHQGMDSATAYSRAQILLERLIFLYFLQNRGWLNQDRNFLRANLQKHAAWLDDFSYYKGFLEQLFWTLATPSGSNGVRLHGIPFLNGGLFDDDEFAQTPRRMKESPPLKVRNCTFIATFDNLLDAFNFTVCEDTPLDQDVAVDPEMLGKVFESIVLHAEEADPDAVAPDRRKATGSYYTPRIVVHFICRETLLQWLKTQLGIDWTARLKALFEIDPTDGLDADDMARLREALSPAEGARIGALLKGVTCCDPAVGSGAFPVGLLHELLSLQRVTEAAANGYVDPIRKEGREWLHRTKARIVENCLYGVDIQEQAIEICRLRLWLSLVVDYDLGLDPFEADVTQFRDAIAHISQLPNLEMNFHRGDSLHDYVSGIPVIVGAGGLKGPEKRTLVDAIRGLARDLHTARRSDKKKRLRVDILSKRLDLAETVLAEELYALKHRDVSTRNVLFGIDASDAEGRKRLAHEMEQLAKALKKVGDDRKRLERLAAREYDSGGFYRELRRLEGADFDSPFNFAWRLDLPSIFGREPEGFDVIVGNPPFVTARNPKKRELYRKRWADVCHQKYLLVCPFFQLSFSLLNPGGQLGFIVSNAFAKREFGKPLVEKFFPTVDLQKVVDCSGLMFPGHGTPTCIVFGRNEAAEWNVPIRITATLPGGGDLRTPPEDSPLWYAIAAAHDSPGHADARITVADRTREDMAKWPWNLDSDAESTRAAVVEASLPLMHLIIGQVGPATITRSDEVFIQPLWLLRRAAVERTNLRPLATGDSVRDYSLVDPEVVIFPYGAGYARLNLSSVPGLRSFLAPFRTYLENVIIFDKPKKDTGIPWWEYTDPYPNKNTPPLFLGFTEIATHAHFLFNSRQVVFPRTAPVVRLPQSLGPEKHHLLAGLLNSSAALFWLKQVCFSKRESQEGATDTYFVFGGGKVEKLPVPGVVADAMRGNGSAASDRLTTLSEACWERGQRLPALSAKKLFEKPGEAYHEWNSSLVGYEQPDAALGKPFETAAGLRAAFHKAAEAREGLRAEMIARQEEMDWLVYAAYGLICDAGAVLPDADLVLAREERPFCLWAAAGADIDKAVALIPKGWSAAKQALWRARLALIRDNEHVRRIEQPVYKRRWDEQWKVGNRWQCGPVAYDAELVDAFYWWLSEKAEWWLEHEGRAVTPDEAAEALWDDKRVQAAWEVAAEAMGRIEAWKGEERGEAAETGGAAAGRAGFERFLKKLVKDQSVPEGIPIAVPWEELERKKIRVSAQTKRIRGKLNVPRERFRVTEQGLYKAWKA
jgi:hypothetical protein